MLRDLCCVTPHLNALRTIYVDKICAVAFQNPPKIHPKVTQLARHVKALPRARKLAIIIAFLAPRIEFAVFAFMALKVFLNAT